MNETSALSKNSILTELTKSPHGKLVEYLNVGRKAAIQDPEFYSRLIAWNNLKGQIRDSKVALPTIAMTTGAFPAELTENALAHLALLDPRNLVRAIRFSREIRESGRSGKNAIVRMVKQYLDARVASRQWFDKNAVQHRRSLQELYALTHQKPSEMANVILFGRGTDKVSKPYPRGSVFEAIAQLKDMSPAEAAGTILNRKIPFLIAKGALGAKAKDPDVVLALINQMSPTELVTNSKMLQKLGVRTNPALRGAYEAALAKAGTSKQNTLKTSRAAEALEVGADDGLAQKLRALQEKQIDALGGIDGSWLILADKSGSMHQAIETARHIATTLARFVKGEVHLVFFDTAPRYVRATGKTLEDLRNETRLVTAGGGTSIGCALVYALEKGLDFDGIAIVSDGEENTSPLFPAEYARMVNRTDRLVPVYFYQCQGGSNNLTLRMSGQALDIQTFDLRSGLDYYSLPTLVQTMRTNRYSLIDEIMETPLLTLDQVFSDSTTGKKEEVLSYA